MAFPMYTQGEFKSTVASMNIGDYIAAEYTNTAYNAIGTIAAFGDVNSELADYTSENYTDGVIYYMKLDKGLLMPCCQMGNTLSYYNLASEGLIHGKVITLNDQNFLWRLPTSREFNLMCSTLGGVLDYDHRVDQFGSGNEWVSDINNSAQGGYCNVSNYSTNNINAPSFAATNVTVNAFRLVLSYVDNPNSTDLYH